MYAILYKTDGKHIIDHEGEIDSNGMCVYVLCMHMYSMHYVHIYKHTHTYINSFNVHTCILRQCAML